MNTYLIPLTWSFSQDLFIQADSREEAIQKAEQNFIPEGPYLKDSFKVVKNAIEIFPYTDRKGNPLFPYTQVRVYRTPTDEVCLCVVTTLRCKEEPIIVRDFAGDSHPVPSKNLEVIYPEATAHHLFNPGK